MTSLELHTFRIFPGATELIFNWEYTTHLDDGGYLMEGLLGTYEATIRFDPILGFSGVIYAESNPFSIKPFTADLSVIDILENESEVHVGDLYSDVLDEYIWEFSEFDYCAAQQDVLFVRSSTADGLFPIQTNQGEIPNFERYVTEIVLRANRTLLNSAVGSKSINAIVHEDPIDIAFTATTDTGFTVELHAALQQIRQDSNADVVAYYAGEAIPNLSAIAGVSTLNTTYSSAYILSDLTEVSHSDRFPRVFTHEIGHINGGAHQKAHDWIDPRSTSVRDLTQISPNDEYQDSTKYRVPYYSNPNVEISYQISLGVFEDVATGTPPPPDTDHNNAIIISNRFCTISEFELPGNFQTIASTSWPNGYPLCYTSVQLEAQVFSGNTGGLNNGPYTYEWSYQTHGSQMFIPFSSAASPIFSIPDLNHTSYVLRLTVTDVGTGNQVSHDMVVKFVFCDDFVRKSNSNLDESVSYENESVFDRQEVKDHELIVVEVFDVAGRRILKTEAPKIEVIGVLRSHLPSGIYILKESLTGERSTNLRRVWIN